MFVNHIVTKVTLANKYQRFYCTFYSSRPQTRDWKHDAIDLFDLFTCYILYMYIVSIILQLSFKFKLTSVLCLHLVFYTNIYVRPIFYIYSFLFTVK